MQVGAAAPEDGQVAPQAVVAADLAVLVGEVFVEGLGNDGLVDHCAKLVCEVGVVGIHGAGVSTGFVGVGILAERIAVDAVGAIVLDSLGLMIDSMAWWRCRPGPDESCPPPG